MSAPALIQACIRSGLRRGDVTAAGLTRSHDRLGFRLTLTATPTAEQAAAMAESITAALTPHELTMTTPHGAWVWRAGPPTFDASSKVAERVQFVARLATRIDDGFGTAAFEACLAQFRIQLQSRTEPPSGGTGFTADDIEVLDGLAAVRRRPQMYIGSTATAQVLIEPLMLATGRGWLTGGTTRVDVTLEGDALTLRDHGVPFSFEVELASGQTQVARAFLNLFGLPPTKDEPQRFGSYGGPHQLAELPLVTALSASVSAEAGRGGVSFRQRFAVGQLQGPPEEGNGLPFDGSEVRVVPDLNIFDAGFDVAATRLAVLTLAERAPGLEMSFNGERFRFESFVGAGKRAAITPPLDHRYFDFVVRAPSWTARCALGISVGEKGGLVGLTNLTAMGGSHVRAVLMALGRAAASDAQPRRPAIEDLVGAVATEIAAPRFDVVDYDMGGGRTWELSMVDLEQQLAAELERPLSVFLDSVPGARERLVERWAQRRIGQQALPG